MRISHTPEMDTEWIRKQLERPGKTQRGLAAAMGIDTTGVNRLLNGKRRLQASEIESVRAYFDGAAPRPAAIIPSPDAADRIKVLGLAECGPDGWSLWNGEIVDMVPRPPVLSGAPNGFAVYVIGTSMENRYHPGELVYVHPGRPVTPGAYVLVQLHPKDGDAPRAFLKRLVKRSGNKVVLEQFEPKKTFTLTSDEILSMYRVVGSGEA